MSVESEWISRNRMPLALFIVNRLKCQGFSVPGLCQSPLTSPCQSQGRVNRNERDLLCVSGVRMVFCKVMSSKRLNGWL